MLIEAGDIWFKQDRYWVKNESHGEAGISFIGTATTQPTQDKAFTELGEVSSQDLFRETERLLYVALTLELVIT